MSSEAVHALIALSVTFSILIVLMVSSLVQIVLEKRKYKVLNALLIVASSVGFLLSIFFLVFSSPGHPAELEDLSMDVDMPGIVITGK